MADALAAYGRIDVLTNVAGGTIWFQSFQYYTPEQIQAEMDRSFWTAMWCCRAVLPHMIDQGSRGDCEPGHARRYRPVPGALRCCQSGADWPDHVAGPGGGAPGHPGELRRAQRHRRRRPGNAPGPWCLGGPARTAPGRTGSAGRIPPGHPQLGRFQWVAEARRTNRQRPSPSWHRTTHPTSPARYWQRAAASLTRFSRKDPALTRGPC